MKVGSPSCAFNMYAKGRKSLMQKAAPLVSSSCLAIFEYGHCSNSIFRLSTKSPAFNL